MAGKKPANGKRPPGSRNVDIKSRRVVFKGRYRIEEFVFDFDRVSGKGRVTGVRREIFDRGDSVAGLVHDVERDVVILTEQFRAATYDKGPGYIIEAMAGSVEEGEAPEDCLRREMLEEIGYCAGKLVPVSEGYASPGSSSERIFLFYAPVRTADLVDPKASGVAAEKEDIGRVELTRAAFLKRLDRRDFHDAKLIALGYWLKSRPDQGRPKTSKGGRR
jgi:nudix-type nucleoside diphosphatase (YffH/AdpP family)